MAMPATNPVWTREMVLALPEDGRRYELIDGELLVTPSPALRHQHALQLLNRLVDPFVVTEQLGTTLVSPADLSLGGKQMIQPDLFVLPELPADGQWTSCPNPILVVEILSPDSGRGDRIVKRRRCQRAGIPEYWVVDLDARAVERWRPGDERAELLDERLVWHPAGAGAALEIPLPKYFGSVRG